MKPYSCPLLFMGTPEFSVPILSYLLHEGFPIKGVYSQPPRPKGRGYSLTPSPVSEFAQKNHLTVLTPPSLRDPSAQQQLHALVHKNDVKAIIVAAYGLLLPQEVLISPPWGCINVHASLLPRWRGAAPIQRSIEAGDHQTGISIMHMDTGLDTGPVYLEQLVSIAPTETTQSLSEKLSLLGGPLIYKTLQGIQDGTLTARPQPLEGITYAHKIHSKERMLDFNQPAWILEKKIRAFSPQPGVLFSYNQTRIKILSATVETSPSKSTASYPPGTILDRASLTICCGHDSLLKPTVVQKEGGRPLPIEDFQRGFSFIPFSSVSPFLDS